jgi:hypothetical protein
MFPPPSGGRDRAGFRTHQNDGHITHIRRDGKCRAGIAAFRSVTWVSCHCEFTTYRRRPVTN